MHDKYDPSEEHLGSSELARLIEQSRGLAQAKLEPQALHPHLAVCASCRKKFEGLSLLDRQLQGISSAAVIPQPDACPVPQIWREIAGGLTPPSETLHPLEHASRCPNCGPLLRAAVAEVTALHGELTEAERRRIATLASAGGEWQRNLARRIAANPTTPPQWSAPWRRFTFHIWRWLRRLFSG